MSKILEIIALDVRDATEAEAGGATSLEIIRRLDLGGLTPDFETLRAIRTATALHLNVIVRPHAHDFVYSPDEIDVILHDAAEAVRLGADGIVFGAITPVGCADIDLFKRVADVCRNVHPAVRMTFHRAIEHVADPESALEALRGIADRVLCSGLASPALADGSRDLLRRWVERYGEELHFACGGGVKLDNIRQIADLTHAPEYHVGAAHGLANMWIE